jgi:hypothetical protein
MSVNSSFQSVAEQVINFNNNLVEALSKLNQLTTSPESSVSVNVTDNSGIARQINLPSFAYLQAEINRLNNNINSIYGLDGAGSLIQSSTNKFRKVALIDLNREPSDISALNLVSEFKSSKNWFFDSLLNPMLFVEFDLSNKIDNSVRKCLVRRYIIDFEQNINGTFTQTGQSALISFNSLFRGKNNILINELENWYRTTPGVSNPNDINYDEQIFDVSPNELQFDGLFSVIKTETDSINRKLWYHLNTLEYTNKSNNELKQLSINDELIINAVDSSSRYKVIEVSTNSSNPRVRLERISGLDPIPIATDSLKIYSPIIYSKKLKVSVGVNERCVIFIKPMDAETNILSKNWSEGVGFWTNDLRLTSSDSDNGKFFEQFYIEKVYDYGTVLNDLVAKKIPTQLSATPAIPQLSPDNFKVVQINRHLTDTTDSNDLRNVYAQQKSLKSELDQINNSLIEKNKQLRISRFASPADRNKFENEITRLNNLKNSKSSLLKSNLDEIISLSNQISKKESPKYRVRGFWPIPLATVTRSTKPQEVVQFKVQYRYLSLDGQESPIETFNFADSNSESNEQTQKTAVYSNWSEFKTDVRKRTFDASTNEYFWQIEDVSDADTPNINQLDIPIQQNESIQIRIKSISEVGWPESPIESDWSSILTVDFPQELTEVLNESEFILKEADKEDLRVSMQNEFSIRGIDEHLSETTVNNDKVFYHSSSSILSGFRDSNGTSVDLFTYLQTLENKIKSLEEQITRAKGELRVIIYRNNDEFIIQNGSEISFNVECEDYLDKYLVSGAPTGRVYENNIYVIRDFLLKIKNNSQSSPLGLLSSRNYVSGDIFNPQSPQVFWVNDQNELITSDVTGQTKTQVDNQFVWSVNFEALSQTLSATKLSDNIGNTFSVDNSLTGVMGSTEYNIGYSENTILSFNGNNKSLLDTTKWIDGTESISSSTKLLTTVHPMVSSIQNIVETNSSKVKNIEPGDNNDLNIPIPIYFKMNSLDNVTGSGADYEYINLNNVTSTIKHVKKVKFLLENESDNRPFVFTIKFNINRSKVVVRKNRALDFTPNISSSSQDVSITR